MPRPARAEFPTPVLVTETSTLAALCERLAREPYVTVDTEFMRERTYYPELCVVQLGGAADVAVVDAQAPGLDLASLGELLADARVVKVFHAARQDVEIFLELFGAVPTPLFDTQVAAMVAGFCAMVCTGVMAGILLFRPGTVGRSVRSGVNYVLRRPASPPPAVIHEENKPTEQETGAHE